jgi:hypothetical protein
MRATTRHIAPRCPYSCTIIANLRDDKCQYAAWDDDDGGDDCNLPCCSPKKEKAKTLLI